MSKAPKGEPCEEATESGEYQGFSAVVRDDQNGGLPIDVQLNFAEAPELAQL